MRIRALDRWSAVSLATTAPRPVQGEPNLLLSGRAVLSLRDIARLLEIAIVDLVEAGRGKMEADQLDFGGEAPGDLGAQVARAIDPVALALLPEAEGLHPDDPGHCGEALLGAGAAHLDVDDVTAAKHAPGQFGHSAGEHDAAAIEEGDPVAHA